MKQIIFLFILSITTLSFGQNKADQPYSELLPRQVFLDSIKNDKNVQLADIRTSEEHQYEGSFQNAEHINFLSDNFYQTMEEKFAKDKPLFIHCKGGIKSHKATEKLKALGFKEIYELQGGFDNWTEDQQDKIRKK